MTNDCDGLDAPGGPHAGQSDLDTSHTKLHHNGRQGIDISTINERNERRQLVETSKVVELLKVCLEGVELIVELLPKGGVLRALAGEGESCFGGDHCDWAVAILELSLQGGFDLCNVVHTHSYTVVVLDAASGGGVCQASKSCLRVLVEVANQVVNVLLQGSDGPRGHSNGLQPTGVNSKRSLT